MEHILLGLRIGMSRSHASTCGCMCAQVPCEASPLAVLGGADVDRLPTASTCYNMLKLPNYRYAPALYLFMTFWLIKGYDFDDHCNCKGKALLKQPGCLTCFVHAQASIDSAQEAALCHQCQCRLRPLLAALIFSCLVCLKY